MKNKFQIITTLVFCVTLITASLLTNHSSIKPVIQKLQRLNTVTASAACYGTVTTPVTCDPVVNNAQVSANTVDGNLGNNGLVFRMMFV